MSYNSNIIKKHHIMRAVPPMKIDPIKKQILAEAFALRKDEKYLSCVWAEFRKNNIKKLITDIRARLSISSNTLFPLVNVGQIHKVCKSNAILRVKAKHLSNLTSYSGLFGTNNEIRLLRDLAFLANEGNIYNSKAEKV